VSAIFLSSREKKTRTKKSHLTDNDVSTQTQRSAIEYGEDKNNIIGHPIDMEDL
jgi:hypothetical protein